MIEFVSLFFGLLHGVHAVELSAAGPVAEIELRLDGSTIGVLGEPPWLFDCDFGEDLVPHELVAIARDAEQREIDRNRQWVNLRLEGDAEAAIVFSGGEGGQPRAVGLVWESIGQRRPRAIELELDGQPLAVGDPAYIELPAYDPEAMHFLSATLHFDEAPTRLEASFGGGRGSEIRTDLTAVAITLDEGVKMPRPAQLEGWFLAGGEPVRVHGVEEGEAEVVVVRDPEAQPVLEGVVSSVKAMGFAALGRKSFLRVVSPAAAPLSPTEVVPEMFLWSEPHDAADQGLLWLSQQQRRQAFAAMFPNAVALAGMQAHASTRRRAVVLLLGGSPTERRVYSPAVARNYLRLLQVPFFVWSLTTEPNPEWPDAEDVDVRTNLKLLRQAIRRLRETLDAQRIVWLEGSYLPQAIELAPQARGIRLAGSGP